MSPRTITLLKVQSRKVLLHEYRCGSLRLTSAPQAAPPAPAQHGFSPTLEKLVELQLEPLPLGFLWIRPWTVDVDDGHRLRSVLTPAGRGEGQTFWDG